MEKYEVTKTVRFGLVSYTQQVSKNRNYNFIAEQFKENFEIRKKLKKYKRRITESSSKEQWQEEKEKLQLSLDKTFDFVQKIKESLELINDLRNDSKHNLNINFKISFIKKSCGFGKDLFSYDDIKKWNKKTKRYEAPRKLSLLELTKNKKLENVKKHSEEYGKCSNKFEAYKLFLKKKLEFIENNIKEIQKLLESANHEKARLTEINNNLQKIIGILKLLNNVYVEAIIFSGNIKKEVKVMQNKILDIKSITEEQVKNLEEISENIHNPKHGYEVGKATLHYRTINKRFIPENEIDTIQKLLGNDSLRGGEFHNPLAQFSSQILEVFKNKTTGKGKDKRLEIEKEGSIVEKAQKVIELVREIDEIKEEDVTLWNICNALNNKKQTYNEFITQNIDFKDLGWKQRLKFGLTILVDCDVYKPKDFLKRCKELEKEVRDYIYNKIKFKEYDKYKSFTQKIFNEDSPSDNAKERGKLISGVLQRDFVLVNKEISQIRGALGQYLKYLESFEGYINMVQYFTVLAKNKEGENILLFIEREKSKNFYKKINSNELPVGNEKLYLYDSLTEKALQKLFNQIYSKKHPFVNYKNELQKQKDKEIDKIKFKDLTLEELKNLFKDDIALKENWENKFSKFYNKLSSFRNVEELLQNLTTNAFVLKEKKFDLQKLQKEFPTMIVVKPEMNINQKKTSIHKNYFERAFKKMLRHKDVDVKINPEFQIYYTPERDKNIRQEKIYNILKRGFEYNKEKIETKEQSKKFCEKEHRFWRNVVTIGVPIEIKTKKPVEKNSEKTRVIGIDRGEKKIATLCVLEKTKDGEYIIPIEYYDENKKVQKSYFLDLAQFKIGRINGEQKIIKWKEEDKNLELKKYEFITRFIKTIWIKSNRKKIQNILGEFKEDKINDEEYIREFINNLTYTNKEKSEDKIKNKILNNDGLGKKSYQADILDDIFVLEKIAQMILDFNKFDFKTADIESIVKQQELELEKVRFRDTIASNIAGIVDFMFRENEKENIETYCTLENLHNSRYLNFYTEDKITGNKLINDDFVESTHNKLYQTGVYGKIEQAIMNKLQVHKKGERGYFNHSFDKKRKNQMKEIQFELKEHSKSKRNIEEEFKGKTLKIQESKSFGNIVFVDPQYTSKRCPKCNITGGKNVKRQNKETQTKHDDKIECKKCGYESSLNIEVKDKVELDNAHTIISTGDDNGAFFIGLRGLETF